MKPKNFFLVSKLCNITFSLLFIKNIGKYRETLGFCHIYYLYSYYKLNMVKNLLLVPKLRSIIISQLFIKTQTNIDKPRLFDIDFFVYKNIRKYQKIYLIPTVYKNISNCKQICDFYLTIKHRRLQANLDFLA